MTDGLYLVADIIASTVLIGIGFAVLIKNPRVLLNALFFIFSTTTGLWIISNYYSNDHSLSHEHVLLANNLVFLFSALSVITLFAFISALTADAFVKKYSWVIFSLSSLSIVPVLTSTMIASIVPQGNVYAVKFGPFALVYFFLVPLVIVWMFIVLSRSLNTTKGLSSKNSLFLRNWLLVVIGLLLITNFILPSVMGLFQLTQIGMLALVVLAIVLLYTIFKNRLFDLKFVIVRSIAYLFSITVLALLYSFIMFAFIRFIFDLDISILSQVLFSVVVALTSFILLPLRRLFDHITGKLFFRDLYDSQELIDKINQTLLSTNDITRLLEKTALLIKDTLKTNYCTIGVMINARSSYFLHGTEQVSLSAKDIEKISRLTKNTNETIFIPDYLAKTQNILRLSLVGADIALLAKITKNYKEADENVGYIILGPKKSGNTFSKQDEKIIHTISKVLVVGIQNALLLSETQHFNETLQQKVDIATKRLRNTNEKLQALDSTKDDFISMASHQLRTPLTSVKGYLSMVLDGDAGEITETQRKLLNQAFVSSQRMVYTIADLLNVSRLKTGKFIIERSPVNLADIVQQEITPLIEAAQVKNVTLSYTAPDFCPPLMLDETKIRQVIMNFIDNAIYYTPSGGKITVHIKSTSKMLELNVTDTGMGVPKADQPHMFTKFYRAQNAQKARPDGTGLGLFMAKKIIAAQGGSIVFKSSEGKGSTFGFSFPLIHE